MGKEFLDGYIGVKFEAICMEKKLPASCEKYKNSFKENGLRLLQYNMAPANGGNMSTRFETGFLITASGCNLGCVEDDEITYVEEFSLENKWVKYRGCCPPSSETFLHGLLYSEKPDIQSVIHAHDEIATSMKLSGVLDETEREEPYGTIELAQICLETFKKGKDIIVLKNHGYVTIGPSLTQTTDTIINMHHHLLQLSASGGQPHGMGDL
ncbi:MAG: class II aldolase/adducin family protein [Candidatus Aminicenantes bacterium]|jgi:L-fuculose-phosphate aldolase